MPEHLPFVRTGRGKQAFIVHTRDHVRETTVAILIIDPGIKGLDADRQNNRPDIDFGFFRPLPEIYRIRLTNPAADIAFFLFQVQTAFIDIGNQGNRLGKINMDRFVLGNALIEFIRITDRTVFDAGTATGTFVFGDIAGPGFQDDLEIAGVTLNPVNLGKCQNLDVWMPADLDQFR